MRSSGVCGKRAAFAFAAVVVAGCGAGGGTLSGSGGAGGRGVILGAAGSGAGLVGGRGGFTNCGEIPIPAAKLPPDILIVLDTSASMNDPIDGTCASDCAAHSKWAAAVAGINTVVDATPTSVNWGLAFLASSGDLCDTGGIAVPVQPYASVMSALAARSTGGALTAGGNRPTRAAVDLAAAFLSGRGGGPHRMILLVTDGASNCGPGAADVLADDTEGTVRAATDAMSSGVNTAVVGLATTGGSANVPLSRIAVAGGLARASAPPYYPAASAGDLVSAMNALAADASDCTFAIPPPPTNDGTYSRENIYVLADQTPIPQDPLNGWTYLDDSHISMDLHGSACDAVRTGAVQTISVVFACYLG